MAKNQIAKAWVFSLKEFLFFVFFFNFNFDVSGDIYLEIWAVGYK